MATLVTILLFVLICIFLYVYFGKSNISLRHLPSPKEWPIIGHLLDLDPRCAHLILTKWSNELGGVFYVKVFREKIVVLSSYDAIYEALVTRKNSVAGRSLAKKLRFSLVTKNLGIISANPSQKWKRLRNACHRHLKMQGDNRTRIEKMIQGIIQEMIQMIKDKGNVAFDPQEFLYHTTVSVTSSLLVGKEYRINDELTKKMVQLQLLFEENVGVGFNGLLLDACPWLRYFGNATYKKILELIPLGDEFWSVMKQDGKANVKKLGWDNLDAGLIVTILKLQDHPIPGAQIDDQDAKVTFQNILGAGISTTSRSFYACLNILIHYIGVQNKIQQEIDQIVAHSTNITLEDRERMPYTQATIFELLRYTSIVPLAIPHETLEDTFIQGYRIPSGTEVLINLWALHHDERLWEKPFEFRPERFLDAEGNLLDASSDVRRHLLPFGAGTRVCIGEVFALARLFLLIAITLQHFNFKPGGRKSSCDPRTYVTGGVLCPQSYEVIATCRT